MWSFFFGLSVLANAGVTKPPNIILIIADDMGWKDLSYIDDTFNETPNIDELAKQGTFFSQAYAPAPSCVPSRASLLTGQSTARLKVYIVGSPTEEIDRRRKFEQPSNRFFGPIQDVKSLGNYFLEAGYKTAYIGKWGVGIHNQPKDHGYQEQFAASRVGMTQSYFSPWGIADVNADNEGEYLTDTLTNKAVRFINQPKENPFLLTLSYYAPHVPWESKKDKIDYFREKDTFFSRNNPIYAAMLSSVDDGVGKVVEALRNTGQLDNTIVVFLSDNGPEKMTGDIAPFTGYKSSATEGGLKVPFIFYSPNHVSRSVENKPVSLESLVPTLLSMAGIVPPSDDFDSQSFAGLLKDTKNNELGDDYLFWHLPAYSPGATEKSIWFSLTPVSIIRHGNWKLVEDYEAGKFKLFNTKNDPAENKNLFFTHPKIAEELKQQLRLKQKKTKAITPKMITPDYEQDSIMKKWLNYSERILFLLLASLASSIYMVMVKTGIALWLLLTLIGLSSVLVAFVSGYFVSRLCRL